MIFPAILTVTMFIAEILPNLLFIAFLKILTQVLIIPPDLMAIPS